jgi:hypothetical protein
MLDAEGGMTAYWFITEYWYAFVPFILLIAVLAATNVD